MRNQLIACAAVLCLAAQSPAAAQAPKPAATPAAPKPAVNPGAPKPAVKPSVPAPRLANGTPDSSGVWLGGAGAWPRNPKPADPIEVLPAARKAMVSRQLSDSPEARGVPTRAPRKNPYPWR